MDRMTKGEREAEEKRNADCAEKHRLLRSILVRLEKTIRKMDGGVHTVGTRANPEPGKEDEWCIIIELRKKTDAFNNELGTLRRIVVKLLKGADPKLFKRIDFRKVVQAEEKDPPQRA